MEDILRICAGLDVHQENVVACVLNGELYETPKKEIRTFETKTEGLLELLDWLEEKKCSHVVNQDKECDKTNNSPQKVIIGEEPLLYGSKQRLIFVISNIS